MLSMAAILISKVFLSTLSLRRATAINGRNPDFEGISIHALLAESDAGLIFFSCYVSLFLSTLSLRRATEAVSKYMMKYINISIHALLAESDKTMQAIAQALNVFLSTLSLRRATEIPSVCCSGTSKFLSTLSLRRATTITDTFFGEPITFLSTLSLRRATKRFRQKLAEAIISIHALLAESDMVFYADCLKST